MSAEGIASVDLVIDADGIAKTGRALQTLERYMDKLRKRAEALSRVRVTISVKLSDCLCGPMKAIRTKLTELTSRIWEVSVRAKFEMDRKLVEKLKAKVKVVVETDVKVNVAASATATASAACGCKDKDDGDKGKPWWKKALSFLGDAGKDILKDRLKELANNVLGKVSDKKGMGWLKAFLPKSDNKNNPNNTVKCICQCKCGGSGYGGNDHGRRRAGRTDTADSGTKKSWFSRTKDWIKEKGSKVGGKVKSIGGKGLEMAKKIPLGSIGKGILAGAGKAVTLGGKALSGAKSLAKSGASAVLGAGAAIGGKALETAKKIPLKSIGKGLLKGAGKLLKPLGIAMDVADIATAKPGQERNRAIGRTVGGAAGAAALGAIGTMILPGFGTMVGSTLGGMAGEWLGDKVGGSIGKIKGLFRRKNKNKQKAPEAMPAPSGAISPLSPGSSPVPNANASSPVNINIPAGAVQLTVQNPDIDYDKIAVEIGARMSVSIKQAVENRAS